MTELLMRAARHLGVPTEVSAGPGPGLAGASIWARWPREPRDIAQDVLEHLTRTSADATVIPVPGTSLWRARQGDWSHVGLFEEVIAHLAEHILERSRNTRRSGRLPSAVHRNSIR